MQVLPPAEQQGIFHKLLQNSSPCLHRPLWESLRHFCGKGVSAISVLCTFGLVGSAACVRWSLNLFIFVVEKVDRRFHTQKKGQTTIHGKKNIDRRTHFENARIQLSCCYFKSELGFVIGTTLSTAGSGQSVRPQTRPLAAAGRQTDGGSARRAAEEVLEKTASSPETETLAAAPSHIHTHTRMGNCRRRHLNPHLFTLSRFQC